MKRNKVLNLIQYGGKDIFNTEVEEQIKRLNSLKEPKDDIERSYNQFLCQNFFTPKWKQVVLNIISFFAILPVWILFLFKRLSTDRGENKEVIACAKNEEEIIPFSLKEKYDIFYYSVRENQGHSLSMKDSRFIFKIICRHPFSTTFNLKNIIKIAGYSELIKKYNPSIHIVQNEYSYTSSILTLYSNMNNIRHINVVHGDKLFNIRDSFFRFNKCYVWEDHYIKLFIALRAYQDQFEEELPLSLMFDTEKYRDGEKYADYKYYLQTNKEDEILSIVESMKLFKLSGKTVKYRPHPVYTDTNILKKYVSVDEIEYSSDVSILESISNSEFIISSYSTVLLQAYYAKKQTIIDDVTYKKRFNKLKELHYFMVDKCNYRLSEYKYFYETN